MSARPQTPAADFAALKDRIRAKAQEVGFDAIGIAPAVISQRDDLALRDFISNGWHGTMSWMEPRIDQRAQPQTLWPEARSIIALGLNYGPETNPLERLSDPGRANISVYAENKDYHDIVKKRLKQLGRWLVAETGCDIKVFVDTAPVPERAIAAQSGLGWQGKHCNIVSRRHGSWLFLGEIYTTLDLPPDEPERDHCGSCSDCIKICPTDAIIAPHKLDARRCISYLTIEHDGPIPPEFRKAIGNRIYGCDDCLAVCPWNKFAQLTAEEKLQPRPALKNPRLADFLMLDDAAFRTLFSGSPVKRIGRNRFIRNCCIAAGNSADPSLLPALQRLRTDPDVTVAEAALWAAGELSEA